MPRRLAGVVILPHRFSAGAREIVGRKRGLARLDLDDLHAETLAGVVVLPHRIGAGARQIVGREILGRKRGLDVHCGLPLSAGLLEQAS